MVNFKYSITLVTASYYIMFFKLEMEPITIDTHTPEKYVRYTPDNENNKKERDREKIQYWVSTTVRKGVSFHTTCT
jgi:hypothetical protein